MRIIVRKIGSELRCHTETRAKSLKGLKRALNWIQPGRYYIENYDASNKNLRQLNDWLELGMPKTESELIQLQVLNYLYKIHHLCVPEAPQISEDSLKIKIEYLAAKAIESINERINK